MLTGIRHGGGHCGRQGGGGLTFKTAVFEMGRGPGFKNTGGVVGLLQEGQMICCTSKGRECTSWHRRRDPRGGQWVSKPVACSAVATCSTCSSPVGTRSVRSVPGTLPGAKIHYLWS